MKRGLRNLDSVWDVTLQEMCNNGRAVELALPSEADEDRGRRVRLLQVNDAPTWVVEKPHDEDGTPFVKGQDIIVYALNEQQRLVAKSTVKAVGKFHLNETKRVTALQLSPATDVASAQRRACFRVPTAGVGLSPVKWRVGNAGAMRRANLTDISDSGAGLSVSLDAEELKALIETQCELLISLDTSQVPLEIKGTIVRHAPGSHGNTTLGISFAFGSAGQRRRTEAAIQSFSATQQRKQIRRMRGVA